MKKYQVLIAWELGGEYGHITSIRILAESFLSRGYEVSIAAPNLPVACRFLEELPVKILQSPVFPNVRKPKASPVCIPEIWLNRGYGDRYSLQGLVLGWKCLYELIEPDLVIFDFSPTALLAARSYSFMKVVYGIAYTCLPVGSPAICLYPNNDKAYERTRKSEKAAVNSINKILECFGDERVDFVGDLYDVNHTFVTSPEVLDLYRGRRTSTLYCPPLKSSDVFTKPDWPISSGKRVFVYLKKKFPVTETFLKALSCLPISVFAVIPDLDEMGRDQNFCEGLNISRTQVDIKSAIDSCDIVCCHGGLTAVDAVMAGKPVVLAPTQLEQMTFARQVKAGNLGEIVNRHDTFESVKDKVLYVLQSADIVKSISYVVRSNSEYNSIDTLEVISSRCENFLKN